MGRYLAVSLVRGVLTLFAVSVLVFFMARLTGDPLDVLAPVDMSREDQEALLERWGLNDPLPTQYVAFLRNAVRGDFGPSFKYPTETAGSVIFDRLPNSIKLGLVASALTVLIGIPLGIFSALQRGSVLDTVARGFALFGQSVPEFWLGIVLIWIVAVRWHVVPTSGVAGWQSYILPSLVISIFGIAALTRLFRSAMLETLGAEYVKLARLKGLAEVRVVLKHALKPASIPPLTFFGGIAVRMLTGATVVEIVFSWPGVGLLAFEAANARDFPVVQGLALFTAAVIVVMNLLVDVTYAYLDPRVRLGQKAAV